MKRRQFLQLVSLAGVSPFVAAAESMQPRRAAGTPFRLIYSNDTTHILSCRPPGPTRSQPFTDELLKQSIVEAAAADAHFLQPGLGWIPWWKSEVYPIEDHFAWLQREYNVHGVNRIGRYLLEGGDLLRTFVEVCKPIGVAPFLSFRLNDGHHTRDLAKALRQKKPTVNMSRHYWDNYQKFRIGPDPSNWDEAVFDWSIPEVRNHKFALIAEAMANYDLAGLELDFLRHWNRFRPEVPLSKRRDITTAFVGQIRELLDRTAGQRGLPRRWLCIRVPANPAVRPEQGIDLADLAASGVDMVNLSHSYFTWQDESVRHARNEVGEKASVYNEMTHTTMTGKATAGSGTQPFLRTTDEQFYTTARLAFAQGADGVSLFNFPYYRYHVTETIGPFHEPPFHVLSQLRDRDFLKRQAQWSFLSSGRNDVILGDKPLPAVLKRAHSQAFPLLMLPVDGNHPEGMLRLRSDESIADRQIEVRFNGDLLQPIAPCVSPLPHPYQQTWLGKPEELACYSLPSAMPIRQTNEVQVTVKRGNRVRLIYLDAVLPAGPHP